MRARVKTAAVVAAVAGVTVLAGDVVAAPSSASGKQEPQQRARITVGSQPMQVSPGIDAAPIPGTFIGANHRWPGGGLGMWDADRDAPVPAIVDAAKRSALDVVRYPGGTVANMFDFTEAVGPQAERGCQTSAGFIGDQFGSVDSTYGPDENERFVDAIGGRSMIMVPMITRSAQDGADFVEYMNAEVGENPNGGTDWAQVRADNGHDEPYDVELWEVGNEPYLPNQRYWRSADDQEKLQQFLHGGWQRQTADSDPYQNNDGLFRGCDLRNPVTGNGEPGQQLRVRYAPIALPGDATPESGPIEDTVLRVDGAPWDRVADVSAAGPDAAVYEVLQETGEIRFGDGEHGRIPPAGATFSVEYTSGRHDGFLDFHRALKEVDPDISVCSGWGKPVFVEAMGTRAYDCLGFHMYSSPAAGDEDTPQYPITTLYHDLMRRGANPAQRLDDINDQLAGQFPDPGRRPFVAVTEFGTLVKASPTGERMPANYTAMLMHNVYNAGLMISQLKNGVPWSTSSNLNGPAPADEQNRRWVNLLGSAPHFMMTGRAKMTGMFAGLVGATAHRSQILHNPPASGGDYRALRSIVTCGEGGELKLIVTNQDIEKAVPATIGLQNFPGRRGVTVKTLTASGVDAFNTHLDQERISVSTEQAVTGQTGFDHTFPAHSVTLVEIAPGSNPSCG